MTDDFEKLEPGALIAGDYLVVSVEHAEPPERCFLADDRESERRVRIVELPPATAGAWAAGAIDHPAIVDLVAVLSTIGSSFGVFEEISGSTALDALTLGGRLAVADAVFAALRVAEALTVLHRSGVVHGSVGPSSLVLKPDQRDKPVLSYAPPSLRPAGYRAPDRRGLLPSREDDLWATGALLYHMLTGQPPPETGLVGPAQVVALDVADELLVGVMVQALAADPNRRSIRIASIRHPLSVWLNRHASMRDGERPLSRKPQVFAWSRPTRARAALSGGAPGASERLLGLSPRIVPTAESQGDPTASQLERPDRAVFGSSPSIEIGPVEDLSSLLAPEEIDADEVTPVRAEEVTPVRPEEVTPVRAEEVTPVRPEHLSQEAEAEETTPVRPVHTSQPVRATSRRRAPLALWIVGAAAAAGLAMIGAAALRAGTRLSRGPSSPGAKQAAAPTASPRPRTTQTGSTRDTPPTVASIMTSGAPPTPTAIGSCIAAHSPPGTFETAPDLSWVCRQTDPRKGAMDMRRAVILGAAHRSFTRAMQLWGALSWYGMAAFAALRGECCSAPRPLELPPPGDGCTPLADALNDVSALAARGDSLDPALKAFDKSVLCELGHGRTRVYWQNGRLHDGERSVLDHLLIRLPRADAGPGR